MGRLPRKNRPAGCCPAARSPTSSLPLLTAVLCATNRPWGRPSRACSTWATCWPWSPSRPSATRRAGGQLRSGSRCCWLAARCWCTWASSTVCGRWCWFRSCSTESSWLACPSTPTSSRPSTAPTPTGKSTLWFTGSQVLCHALSYLCSTTTSLIGIILLLMLLAYLQSFCSCCNISSSKKHPILFYSWRKIWRNSINVLITCQIIITALKNKS